MYIYLYYRVPGGILNYQGQNNATQSQNECINFEHVEHTHLTHTPPPQKKNQEVVAHTAFRDIYSISFDKFQSLDDIVIDIKILLQ